MDKCRTAIEHNEECPYFHCYLCSDCIDRYDIDENLAIFLDRQFHWHCIDKNGGVDAVTDSILEEDQ